MKIERINDNKFRCILSKQDLDDRKLRLSELAYGSEKAKALFRDMMQQASFEFGFEADDIPLMIEAIPTPSESLVLVITKVEDPEELDTRFSKFTPEYSLDDDYDDYDDEEDEYIENYTDEILDRYNDYEENLSDTISDEKEELMHLPPFIEPVPHESETDFTALPKSLGMEPPKRSYGHEADALTKPINITKVFRFHSLEDITAMADNFVYRYQGCNSIYKDEKNQKYYLVAQKSNHTPEEFSKICNQISEYGQPIRATKATLSYYDEHFVLLIRNKALQILANI